jgi:uncharacterized protein with PQ loop repeat
MTQVTAIPGDPDALDSRVRILKTIAVSLGVASKDLRVVANADLVISLAIDEVRDDARESADDANDIYIRYAGTAAALGDYSRELRRIKEAAAASAARFHEAQGDVDYWVAKRGDYEDHAKTPGEDAEHWRRMEREADQEVDEARGRVRASESSFQSLLDELDAAARLAADRIDSARRASRTDDNLIDEIEGAIRDFKKFADDYLVPILEAIQDVCKTVAEVLSIIALVLTLFSFIPGVGAIAAALGTLSLALSAVALLASALLLVLGHGNFTEFVKEAIGVAISVVLKFGASKAISAVTSKIGLNMAQTVTGSATGVSAAQNAINYRVAAVFKGVADVGIDIFKDGLNDVAKEVGGKLVQGIELPDLSSSFHIQLPSFNPPSPPLESSTVPDFGFRETDGALGDLYNNIGGGHYSIGGGR